MTADRRRQALARASRLAELEPEMLAALERAGRWLTDTKRCLRGDQRGLGSLLNDGAGLACSFANAARVIRKTFVELAATNPNDEILPKLLADMNAAWETGEPTGFVPVVRVDPPEQETP